MLHIVELGQKLHRLLRTMRQDLLRTQLSLLPIPPAQIRQQRILDMENIKLLIPQDRPQESPETLLLQVIGARPSPAPGPFWRPVAELLSYPVTAFEAGERYNVTVHRLGQGCAGE